MLIDKEDVQRLRDKLQNHREIESCKREIENILENKRALLHPLEVARPSCCLPSEFLTQLYVEIELLRKGLAAIDAGDNAQAAAILDDYIHELEYYYE
jgi:hypothetical protein